MVHILWIFQANLSKLKGVSFYNEPGFWAFLTALIGSTRWLSRVIYLYVERSNKNKAELDLSVEKVKADNLQKGIDCLKAVTSKHEEAIKRLEESIKMVSVIEKGLNTMSLELNKNCEDFQRKITNVTVSFQKTIDRVDAIEKKFGNLGKVIKL